LKEKDSSLGIHLAITSQQVEELSWTSIAPPKFAWLFSQCRVAWERDIYGLMGRAIIT